MALLNDLTNETRAFVSGFAGDEARAFFRDGNRAEGTEPVHDGR